MLENFKLNRKLKEIDSSMITHYNRALQDSLIKILIFLEQKETLKLFKNQQINIKIFDRDNQIHLPDQMLLEMMKLLLSSKMVLCTNQL